MYIFYPSEISSTPNLQPLFFQFHFPTEYIWLSKMLMLLSIIAQSLLFNRLINDLELFDKSFHLPALVYLFVAWIHIDEGTLEVFSFSNLFILIAIRFFLQVYRQNDSRQLFFNAGLVCGCLYLIAWPLLVLLPMFLLAVNLLKNSNWREWLLFFMGSFLPFFFLQVYYFYCYESVVIPETNLQSFQFIYFNEDENSNLLYFSKCMLVFLLVLAFFMYLTRFNGVIMKVRKQRQFLLLTSLSLITVFIIYSGFFKGEGNGLLIIPLSYLFSFLLVHTHLRVVSDIYFYLIIGLVLIYRYGDFIAIF